MSPRRLGSYEAHLQQVPMFAACSQRELRAVTKAGTVLDVADATVLCRQGDVGREFFVILDGRARVERGGRKVATLGPGDYFGELALLDSTAKRDASVIADGPMEVFVVARPEFTALLEDVPSINRKLLMGMARRLHELDAKVLA